MVRNANALTNISILWQTPILINCGDLNEEKILNVLKPHKNNPAIYCLEIKSEIDSKKIVDCLQKFKDQGSRSCPLIEKKRSLDSKFLYCGSKKKSLDERLAQHLGFRNSSTYALHLAFWANDLNLELEFHYAWLDKEEAEFTELIESALVKKINPLVGKMA